MQPAGDEGGSAWRQLRAREGRQEAVPGQRAAPTVSPRQQLTLPRAVRPSPPPLQRSSAGGSSSTTPTRRAPAAAGRALGSEGGAGALLARWRNNCGNVGRAPASSFQTALVANATHEWCALRFARSIVWLILIFARSTAPVYYCQRQLPAQCQLLALRSGFINRLGSRVQLLGCECPALPNAAHPPADLLVLAAPLFPKPQIARCCPSSLCVCPFHRAASPPHKHSFRMCWHKRKLSIVSSRGQSQGAEEAM